MIYPELIAAREIAMSLKNGRGTLWVGNYATEP
jgi:hypothetical protein